MSDPRKPTEDDIELLVLELGEMKEVLREISRQVLRIERRARVLLPRPSQGAKRLVSAPRLDAPGATRLIDDLKNRVRKGEQIEAVLRPYSVKPELQLIARALGMTNDKLPPKDELVRRISTRIRQSASLGSELRPQQSR